MIAFAPADVSGQDGRPPDAATARVSEGLDPRVSAETSVAGIV